MVRFFPFWHILKKEIKKEEKMKEFLNNYEELNQFPLGMAYVPIQEFTSLYENLEEAFCQGTLFKELDKPFTGRRCVR